MKYGLFGIGSGVCADPSVAAELAQAAESAGFESLWTGEHVVLPDPRQAPSPANPDFAMLHPSTILAFLAGVTQRVKLGTGIVLVAQRNPVVLAKEMASLDVIANGRLLLGIGAGYLHQEFAALGVPFSERGVRTDECVEVMRELWTASAPAFKGRFTQFENIDARPRPVQPGGPPIIVGGTSDAALRRSIKLGNGWYGFALNVAQTGRVLERLNSLRERTERASRLGELELSVTPSEQLTDELVDAYRDLGVQRLIPLMPQKRDAALEQVADIARKFI